MQVVVVNWILSFQIERSLLGCISGGRRWAVLDIFEGLWEVSGRAGCLHQNMFLSKDTGKTAQMLGNVQQQKMSSTETEIIRCGLF